MINQWNQFPFVLRRKILLTLLAGLSSIVISLVVFVVTADRVLLVLGGIILIASLIFGKSLYNTAVRGNYEVIEGAERTLLINKSAKFQIGACYRFYFQKSSQPIIGNDYLDAALSTNSFLGYETVEDTSPADSEQ